MTVENIDKCSNSIAALAKCKKCKPKIRWCDDGLVLFCFNCTGRYFLGRVETLDSYRLPELLSGGTKNAQTAPLHHLAHHRIQKKLLS